MMSTAIDDRTEWLEADGLGGFASGTSSGVRTRRYHALLLSATRPPTGRMVLVSGVDAWVNTPHGRFALTTQRYRPGVLLPDGITRIDAFRTHPWPTWEFALQGNVRISHEIFVERDTGLVVLTWRVSNPCGPMGLEVRPYFAGRDYHALHHENAAFRFEPDVRVGALVFHPYDGVPAIAVLTDGVYTHAPDWYRQFMYVAEQERGLDDTEDLASPGILSWELGSSNDEATIVLAAGDRRVPSAMKDAVQDVKAFKETIRLKELTRRRSFATRLNLAADAYIVRRGSGRTLVAGYPWFTDWGRDTFIAMRGLCFATGRLADARHILLEWADAVSDGMLPNRFPDAGDSPEFNSVDASLWYVVAVHEFLQLADREARLISATDRSRLRSAVLQILSRYSRGTRYGIRADDDGLLAAGVAGTQLTWMDARVDGRPVTARIGKPVEVQALWINALWVGTQIEPDKWGLEYMHACDSFEAKFWNASRNCLYDVVDAEHVAGATDSTFRPNQIFAVGGLPLMTVCPERARQVVEAVEQKLLTPAGLRSLAPDEPAYVGRYEGGPAVRDASYHQGAAWPWLIGPFVEAWIRVRGSTAAARREARKRFVDPLKQYLEQRGLDHVAEIADGDAPHVWRGCPFQAWSLGELLRLDRICGNRQPARSRRPEIRPIAL